MTDHDLSTRTEGEGETLDMPEGMKGFTSGQVLGERYQILEMLGRGGMGEVWHAFDLKLRVEVALKALRPEFFKSERRLELLRQEVRAAREVVSPNVCRIFDLIEVEGRELVSMEYVDGATLLGVLQERGPLDLKEAQDIASQFLAGLEAIHKAGLIHRDIKPENIMLTRAGRVVVMDFGLARQEAEGGGSVSGTPAYMSPEQAAGQQLDARADVYAAGVVLAEMVSPDGITSYESRQSVWEGVRSEPATVPDTPWADVIKKAVAKDREGRFNTAHTLTRALEDVTLRVEGAEDLHPYPGLASFTEEDAEYFFGREAEVEQMWRKLEGPARMLGVVGPSGAGKTSFLQAGLIPSANSNWSTIICKPGTNPVLALGRALGTGLSKDADSVDLLLRFDEPDVAVDAVGRWRRRASHAVVIIDQFEELFTQNGLEVQRRFSALLNRLVLEADVHVLLSLRDDFLARCREYETFAPLFADLTMLLAPTGAALRRALTQPALQCGYRFEDDELVDEMLAEVEGERGALPLLAFAAARLWEKRDRETGLLTRQAYHDIGGVGGALAQHAEATIDHIGVERIPIIRELFRNLVTAEGTRAVREWDELLSIFSDSESESPEEVLRGLIDARLLTSYEIHEDEHEPTRRVEIIHESLLANWPRLVRWQTQDQEGAQLRDEVRQSARAWDEHGRHDDRLWTGTAFREYQLWRERYPGGLTDIEEAFGSAMTSLAGRRRHRRRIVVATVIAVLVAGLAVVGSFWQRSVRETRRAEAAKLLALAQGRGTDPSEALAYAASSLELADTEATRLFAMRTVAAGPIARALRAGDAGLSGSFPLPAFSPDGRWLAIGGFNNEYVAVWPADGGKPVVLGGHAVVGDGAIQCGWSSDGLLFTGHWKEDRVRIWAMPDGRLIREIPLAEREYWQVGTTALLTFELEPGLTAGARTLRLRARDFGGGEPVELGRVNSLGVFDPSGRRWVYAEGNTVYSRALPVQSGARSTTIAQHSGKESVLEVDWCKRAKAVFSTDDSGEMFLWKSPSGTSVPGRRLRAAVNPGRQLLPDAGGRWAVDLNTNESGRQGRRLLWDLEAMAGARPLELRRSGSWSFSMTDIHPNGGWVVASTQGGAEISFWPLKRTFPTVVEGYDTFWMRDVGFTPDGQFLVTNWKQDRVRLWPLPGAEQRDVVDLRLPRSMVVRSRFTIDPAGRHVFSAGNGSGLFVLPMNGGDPLQLSGFAPRDVVYGGAFSPSGNLVAAATLWPEDRPILRVWDLQSGEESVFDLPPDTGGAPREGGFKNDVIQSVWFADENTFFTDGVHGLLRWDIETRTHEQVLEPEAGHIVLLSGSSDHKKLLTVQAADSNDRSQVLLHNLETGDVQEVQIPGITAFVVLGPEGLTWALGEDDGLIRVGQFGGGEPHLLVGHEGPVQSLSISPDRKWIASSGEDQTLRLWPMPDLSKPPLHTLPHDELIAKLKTLTNLRVVRDEESSTGWKLTHDPFPGWETVPTW